MGYRPHHHLTAQSGRMGLLRWHDVHHFRYTIGDNPLCLIAMATSANPHQWRLHRKGSTFFRGFSAYGCAVTTWPLTVGVLHGQPALCRSICKPVLDTPYLPKLNAAG